MEQLFTSQSLANKLTVVVPSLIMNFTVALSFKNPISRKKQAREVFMGEAKRHTQVPLETTYSVTPPNCKRS
jgi:hypothetical protein